MSTSLSYQAFGLEGYTYVPSPLPPERRLLGQAQVKADPLPNPRGLAPGHPE